MKTCYVQCTKFCQNWIIFTELLRFLKMAAICHQYFLKFADFVIWLMLVTHSASLHKIRLKSDHCLVIHGLKTICNMLAVCHFKFYFIIFYFFGHWLILGSKSVALYQISLKYGNIKIFKMATIRNHLFFEMSILCNMTFASIRFCFVLQN